LAGAVRATPGRATPGRAVIRVRIVVAGGVLIPGRRRVIGWHVARVAIRPASARAFAGIAARRAGGAAARPAAAVIATGRAVATRGSTAAIAAA